MKKLLIAISVEETEEGFVSTGGYVEGAEFDKNGEPNEIKSIFSIVLPTKKESIQSICNLATEQGMILADEVEIYADSDELIVENGQCVENRYNGPIGPETTFEEAQKVTVTYFPTKVFSVLYLDKKTNLYAVIEDCPNEIDPMIIQVPEHFLKKFDS